MIIIGLENTPFRPKTLFTKSLSLHSAILWNFMQTVDDLRKHF